MLKQSTEKFALKSLEFKKKKSLNKNYKENINLQVNKLMIGGERNRIFSPQKYNFQKKGGFDQAFRMRFSFNKEEFHLNKPLKFNTMDILKQ